jgi:uridine kinase
MQLETIANKIKSVSLGHKPILIGIEGFGGSGKSTIASKLSKLLGNAFVVNIDDFIIKGNITENDWDKQVFDRQRLEEQVLIPASKGEQVQYVKLVWSTNSLSEPITVPSIGYLIVEGISSYHPSIAHYYDYKVWVDTPIEVAKARGKQRDAGNENEQHWDLWAGNDLAYQQNYHPEQAADFIVKNEGIILDLEPYGMPKGSIVFRSKDTLDQDESDDSQG